MKIFCVISMLIIGAGFLAPNVNIIITFIELLTFILLILFYVYLPKMTKLSSDNKNIKFIKKLNFYSMILTLIFFGAFNWFVTF